MEKITTYNYEAYYLDYLEGNLNEFQTELLFDFIDKHPELKSNLDPDLPSFNFTEGFNDIKLEPKIKNRLKKSLNQNELIAIENLMVEAVEDRLTPAEQSELLQTIKLHQLEQTYSYYKATKLSPDSDIIFPFKKELKQKETQLIPLFIKIGAVAALFAIVFNFINLNISTSTNSYTLRQHKVSDVKFNDPVLKEFTAEEIDQKQSTDLMVSNHHSSPSNDYKTKQNSKHQDTVHVLPKIKTIENQLDNQVVVIDSLNNLNPNQTPQNIPPHSTDVLADNTPKKEPLKLINLYEPVTKTVNNHTALDVSLKKSTPDSEYEVMQVKIGKFSFERKRKK